MIFRITWVRIKVRIKEFFRKVYRLNPQGTEESVRIIGVRIT